MVSLFNSCRCVFCLESLQDLSVYISVVFVCLLTNFFIVVVCMKAFELGTGDFLFDPHTSEEYTRNEGGLQTLKFHFELVNFDIDHLL